MAGKNITDTKIVKNRGKGTKIKDYERESLERFITFINYIDSLMQNHNLSYTSIRDLTTIIENPGITAYGIVKTFNHTNGTLPALYKRLSILKFRDLIFSTGKHLFPTDAALQKTGYPPIPKSLGQTA